MVTIESTEVSSNPKKRKNTRPQQVLSWKWQTWSPDLLKWVMVLTALFVLVVLLYFALRWMDKDLQKKLRQQTSLKLEAQTSLQNSGTERATIERHLPLALELQVSGVLGEEKRLEWVETLRLIEQRWPGLSIQYDIAAQTTASTSTDTGGFANDAKAGAVGLAGPQPVKKFSTFYTEMKLTLQALHEGDVFAVLQELKDAALGAYSLQKCTVRKLTAGATSNSPPVPTQSPTPTAPNVATAISVKPVPAIQAECTLRWASLKTHTDAPVGSK